MIMRLMVVARSNPAARGVIADVFVDHDLLV